MKRRKKRINKDLVKGWKGYKARLERWEALNELVRTRGHSLAEAGKIWKMSKQRVHQILHNYPKLDPDRAGLVLT